MADNKVKNPIIHTSLKALGVSDKAPYLQGPLGTKQQKEVKALAKRAGVPDAYVKALLQKNLNFGMAKSLAPLQNYLEAALHKPSTAHKGNSAALRTYVEDIQHMRAGAAQSQARGVNEVLAEQFEALAKDEADKSMQAAFHVRLAQLKNRPGHAEAANLRRLFSDAQSQQYLAKAGALRHPQSAASPLATSANKQKTLEVQQTLREAALLANHKKNVPGT